MGRLGRPEDGRLAGVPHIGSLCLACEQQRVRVGVSVVVDDPAQEADDGQGDEGGVAIPVGHEAGDGAVDLFYESGHGGCWGCIGIWRERECV